MWKEQSTIQITDSNVVGFSCYLLAAEGDFATMTAFL